ncbi:MAG: sulfatase-like hydrolase/transferase [Moorea sp. SIO4E2]|uniref:sulfatase-like hydrolase/transferase n=1 Tax=Moorena sp. SIO4E2 TaxID=2607826 RepID=UPI0013B9941C|nr:sulfatase-like hydrolase/transferase [Moorena sp. SIO4E2]NEQ10935.1 sulfatase-like hydrolase/transferase [Moorena sp. SIO4E2]
MAIGKLPEKPNILILLNDQDSAAQDWLPEFEKEHLPTTMRLKKNGLSFKKNIIASCACSPSRAALLTGTYQTQNGVAKTLGMPKDKTQGKDSKPTGYMQNVLKPTQINIAHMLSAAGYQVIWKGKWHLSHPINGTSTWSDKDIEYMKSAYGFEQWNPWDAGHSKSDPRTLGGGKLYNNDARFVDGSTYTDEHLRTPEAGCVIEFLNNYKKGDKPFCLIVSLVNPHDIWVAPNYDDTPDDKNTGYEREDGDRYDLPLPKTYKEDLSLKPDVHTTLRAMQARGDNPDRQITDEKVAKNYVGFYGYLKTLVDQEMGKVLDALDNNGLTEDTLIIRTADHGELCLSHGGLREKPYNAYEETINVPLIFSNPKLFAEPKETDTLASAVDLMPTLASIAGVYDSFSFAFRGRDLTPMLTNPEGTIDREYVHFASDDGRLPDELSDIPELIRTIRSKEWKYSVYFTPDGRKFEYEMYNLVEDPYEENNIAGAQKYMKDQIHLHEDLETEMMKMVSLPDLFWVVTEDMEEQEYIPTYHWPTAEEAWEQSRLQLAINQVEKKLSKRKKVRTNRIESIIKNISPDELWWVRPAKMEFNT